MSQELPWSSTAGRRRTDVPTSPGAQHHVRFGHVVNSFSVAVTLALRRGYFAASGIDLDVTTFGNGSGVARALEQGEIDVGVGGHLQTAAAVIAGAHQVILGPLGFEEAPGHLPVALVTEPSILAGSDLEGARVGLSARAAISELQLRIFMSSRGARYETLDLVTMPFNDMAAALQAGTISAVSAPEPFTSLLVAEGLGSVIDRGSLSRALPVGERVMITGLVASADWAERERPVARKLRDAVRHAVADIKASSSVASELVLTGAGVSKPGPAGMHLPQFDNDLSSGDLQRAFDLAFDYGLVPCRVAADDLICPLD